jgi:hypothetical protein
VSVCVSRRRETNFNIFCCPVISTSPNICIRQVPRFIIINYGPPPSESVCMRITLSAVCLKHEKSLKITWKCLDISPVLSFWVGWDCPLGTSAPNSPRMVNNECGAVGGMRIGRGNRSTRRKPAPVSICPPQTRAAALGNRRLTAWAMGWPISPFT